MSFLLGRSQRQQRPAYASTSSSVLYDAGNGHDGDDDDDDELEAAFGESDAPELDRRADYRSAQSQPLANSPSTSTSGPGIPLHSYRPEGHDSSNADDSFQHGETSESEHLLFGGGGTPPAASGSRSQSPRPRLPTTDTGISHASSSPSAGGYDFEADPYERRSAPIALHMEDDEDEQRRTPSRSAGSSQRSAFGGNAGATGLLATLRNALPARFRKYGLLNANESRTGRRNDGTTDHGEEDDDEDDWIAPPPSMPGLYGGGMSNDGVFANMTAKPGRHGRGDRTDIVGGDDEAPEKEIPPAYEMAVLDSAPPYFDNTVHAPGLGGSLVPGVGGGLDEILIEGLPLGNPFSFFWSLLVSMSFQFVGFLLTTLLSTSHAAKNGSRAGLGVTLIQYGLYLGSNPEMDGGGLAADGPIGVGTPTQSGDSGKDKWAAFWGNAGGEADPTPTDAVARLTIRAVARGAASMMNNGTETDPNWRQPVLLDGGAAISGVASSWLSMVLMIGGWFLLVSSLTSYIKAIRYAKALRDGASTNADSWLERGGPIGTLYTRFTGREFPGTSTERTWGLAPRPAPRSATTTQPAAGTPGSASSVPPRSGLSLGSLITPSTAGVRGV